MIKLKESSWTTVSDSNVALGKDPLAGWKDKLSPEEVKRILNVVHRVGIDAYTDAL